MMSTTSSATSSFPPLSSLASSLAPSLGFIPLLKPRSIAAAWWGLGEGAERLREWEGVEVTGTERLAGADDGRWEAAGVLGAAAGLVMVPGG